MTTKLTKKQLAALEFGRRGGYWNHTDDYKKMMRERMKKDNPMLGKKGELHHNWTRKKILCLNCGAEIFRPKCLLERSKKTFCCPDCKKEWFKNNRKDIPYYYYGSKWGKIREAVLARDNYKCTNCSSDQKLEIHHLEKWLESKDNSLNNLVTLCRKCHRKLEPRNIKRLK